MSKRRTRRLVSVGVLAMSAVAPVALAVGPAHADYYGQCISVQRAAYRQDVRDIGQFWADVVWIGRETACRHGWTQL